jgi:hypothetical protein
MPQGDASEALSVTTFGVEGGEGGGVGVELPQPVVQLASSSRANGARVRIVGFTWRISGFVARGV